MPQRKRHSPMLCLPLDVNQRRRRATGHMVRDVYNALGVGLILAMPAVIAAVAVERRAAIPA